ncbi:hypothetical protein M404DRAFT_1001595 [Pisolithus tinctorius Marx 270]|uniref:Uncharacterized protein n=1 Tax=Pisolithus tinctorius Marx 270 TaxID=870435 RepID=A0A0C3P624_PISTI|nr:hypothetical protein M404DRAFT_1001595 [Pisolithus tinctorius Marx 270]
MSNCLARATTLHITDCLILRFEYPYVQEPDTAKAFIARRCTYTPARTQDPHSFRIAIPWVLQSAPISYHLGIITGLRYPGRPCNSHQRDRE